MRDLPFWADVLLGLVVAVLALWAVLLVGLLVVRRRTGRGSLRGAVRLLPDVLRLVKRLAVDRTLTRRVRALVAVLLAYLAMPFDVVPDVIPVLGWADDVVVVVLVLRAVVRSAGPDVVRRHWPGTEDGLRVLRLLVRW
ncbi:MULTISPECIES: YkvA family protein [unclassified Isoptericola]|uniref:YkvA family protein n=1 Tax=unclassified Isoptericola TaxID=2623355 RepID=UPI003668457C